MNGNQIGFLFTSSGAAPACFTVTTTGGVSGALFLSSGQKVSVNSGQISGQLVTAASGVFGTASLNSGQFVLVSSGQLSGQLVNLLSGNSVSVWSGTLVNTWTQINVDTARSGFTSEIQLATTAPSSSGVLVNEQITLVGGTGTGQSRIITSYSGTNRNASVDAPWVVVPDNTTIYSIEHSRAIVISGQLSGQLVTAASGLFATASLNSGQFALVYSGQLSGQPITLLSGLSYTASGIFVTATATIASGTTFLASGQAVSLNSGQSVIVNSGQLSGQLVTAASGVFGTASLNSGQFVLVYSGQLSGQPITLLSGLSYTASGIFATATATIASGTTFLASGQSTAVNSGQFVLVYSGQLSGQQVNLSSGNQVGVWSGTQVNVFSGNTVNTFPGTLTSGERFNTATVFLDLSGSIEGGNSGVTLRQATRVNLSVLAGMLSGAGTGLFRFRDTANTVDRVTAVVDQSGNRTSIVLNTQ